MSRTGRIRVTEIWRTCGACPAQWAGRVAGGGRLYVRYRFGRLIIGVGDGYSGAVENACGGEAIFAAKLGGPWDGTMTYARLRRFAKARIQWPRKEA